MTDKKVWFITGAGRGMGVDIAKAALAAGCQVVATGRNTEAVAKAIGEAEHLLLVKLDITSPADAEAAVKAAVDRFGTIDVLVNNAANCYLGYFEELTASDYAERNAQIRPWWEAQNGRQAGDPAKLAKALITIASRQEPPLRWIAGADAIDEAERKAAEFQQQINAYRDLSSSLAYEDA